SGAIAGADERGPDRRPVLDRRCYGAVLGRGGGRSLNAGDPGRDAALDLDARVAGLDREPLHGTALEALDQIASLLPDGADQLLVGRLALYGLSHSSSPVAGGGAGRQASRTYGNGRSASRRAPPAERRRARA